MSPRHVAALLVAILISGGAFLAAGPIPPEVKQVVAFIFIESPKEKGKLLANGTAFFVGVKSQTDPARSHVYLVTAKHVLTKDSSGSLFNEVFVRLNKKDGKTSDMARMPLSLSGTNKNVYVHSDPTVDIAVIPALPDEKTIEFKFLGDELITTREGFTELKIAEGSEVFFSGLFTPFIGDQRNYPVVRLGRVALITSEKISWAGQKMDLYLTESASYGGNSGSPVFFYLGSDRDPGSLIVGPPVLRLAGVMMGTFLDAQPVRVVEQAQREISVANMGISAVVPAYKLREILFGSELVKQRLVSK